MIFIILAILFAIPGIFSLTLPGHQFLGLAFLFLAALLLLAKWKKKLSLVLFLAALVLVTILEIPIVSASRGHARKDLDVVIVLGCAVYGQTPSLPLRERIDAAASYLHENPDTICIVSGGQGQGEDISEADCMKRELMARGIAKDRIFLEDRSTSTKENIAYSYEIIAQVFPDASPSVGIVSNDFHLFRTRFLASMQGHDVDTISAPTTYLTVRINYYIREAPALVKALFVH